MRLSNSITLTLNTDSLEQVRGRVEEHNQHAETVKILIVSSNDEKTILQLFQDGIPKPADGDDFAALLDEVMAVNF